MKKKGGLLLKKTLSNHLKLTKEVAINYFMENSIIKMLSYDSYGGLLFKCILNDGVESPYCSLNSYNVRNYINFDNTIYLDVRTLILKVVIICDNVEYKVNFNIVSNFNLHQYSSLMDHKKNEIHIDSECSLFLFDTEKFRNENKIQREIYSETFDEYLEPICPKLVFVKNDKFSNCLNFLEVLLKKTRDEKSNLYLNLLLNFSLKSINYPRLFSNGVDNYKFGFIFMESIENETTGINTSVLENYLNRYTGLMYNYWFELYRLSKLGYIHGDSHMSNCLYNPRYNSYIEGTGRALLIDFGMSDKISNRLYYLATRSENVISDYKSELRKQNIVAFDDTTAFYIDGRTRVSLITVLFDSEYITSPFRKVITFMNGVTSVNITYSKLLCLYYEYFENVLKERDYLLLNRNHKYVYDVCEYILPMLIDVVYLIDKHDNADIYADIENGSYGWLNELVSDRNNIQMCKSFIDRRELKKNELLQFVSRSKYKNVVSLIDSLNVSFLSVYAENKGMKRMEDNVKKSVGEKIRMEIESKMNRLSNSGDLVDDESIYSSKYNSLFSRRIRNQYSTLLGGKKSRRRKKQN